ncbi:MAG: hypothetical protein EX341_12630 [Candidatus Scalindua sp. SCAELEC01]|nr:hypothetical protein [Planctomycetota bacterium]RZV75049.1 MAG: hypothetical protein EX341_12630 [Candidatus Scalindua sp. SCAELEC01]
MNRVKLPDYFTTLKKGKVTLFIHKKYEAQLTEQDLNLLFGLYRDSNPRPSIPQSRVSSKVSFQGQESQETEFSASYHGRTPCKSIFLKSLNNGCFVVRDYWHGGLFGKVLRDIFWQGLRPILELVICEKASKEGIETIEILAVIKNRVLGPFYKSKLISREIKNSTDLMELLLRYDHKTFCAQKREIISKVALAIKELHKAGIYHADLNLKNILLQTASGGEFVVYIIDLDKSKQFSQLNPQRRMKNLMRLDRSLEKFKRKVLRENNFHQSCSLFITKGDKVRFLRDYLSCDDTRRPVAAVSPDGVEVMRKGPATDSFRNQSKLLKISLKSYLSSHKTHRFWWWLADLSGKN